MNFNSLLFALFVPLLKTATALELCNAPNAQLCKNCESTECFAHWKAAVQETTDILDSKIGKVVEQYNVDLDALETLLEDLQDSNKSSQEAFEKLGKFVAQIAASVEDLAVKSELIASELEKIRELLDLLQDKSVNIDRLIQKIRDYDHEINELLKELKVTRNDTKTLDEEREILTKIHDWLTNNNNLPRVGESYFNLALDTESYLDLIKEVLGSPHLSLTTNLDQALEAVDDQIDKLVHYIAKILDDYATLPQLWDELKTLVQRADGQRASAENLGVTLDKNLQKEKQFHAQLADLRSDVDTLDSINELLLHFEKTAQSVEALDEDTRRFREELASHETEIDKMERELDEQLELYKNELNRLNVGKSRWAQIAKPYHVLLMELLEATRRVDLLKEFQTIESLIEEIQVLIARTNDCTLKISKYCRSTDRRVGRPSGRR